MVFKRTIRLYLVFYFLIIILFVLGLAGGTIWHLVGGARNAPVGHRISQAISRTRARVPILGGKYFR